ncbi:hypothetical protein BS47DRAFT_1397467 [Hydnum rufescens UP504]|uniref:Cytochrome P450 n=1 Tax=Hydnum rufescens UP504 TaxID=1448309 RepID=A0A9P6AN70_9AGAM|nr:hypothetical protein BS47DRAFT_1397467 [Hydnum rufescens UP504]
MALLLHEYAIFLVLGAMAITILHSLMKPKCRPPGPPGIPVLGNLHKLKNDFRYRYIKDISKTYGDVTFFYNPAMSVLVLSSYRSMQDLLGNRGSIYSDRPGSSIVEMSGGGNTLKSATPNFYLLIRMGIKSLLSETFGPTWKLERKLFHQHMNKGAVAQYWPIVEQEAHRCLRSLHRDPDNWRDALRLNTVRVILGITYDIRDTEALDDELRAAISLILLDTYGSIQRTVKSIPRWVPWLGSEIKLLAAWGKEDRVAISKPFNYVKSQKNAGTAKPSFALNLLEEGGTDERTMTWLSASMYAGGADTTSTMLHAFVLAMLLYPEVQRKAQDEIERVVGSDRLPGMHDRDSLPYVENLIKELVRWWLVSPVALVHRLTEDDEYKGYFIPKGTVVIPCIWCISRDEEMYPDPEAFRPERFDEPNADGHFPLDPHQFSFGIGRRICPGQDFADMVLFANITLLLATTTFSKALDSQGNEITPTRDPTPPYGWERRFLDNQPLSLTLLASRIPCLFNCRIKVRPAAALLTIDNQTDEE